MSMNRKVQYAPALAIAWKAARCCIASCSGGALRIADLTQYVSPTARHAGRPTPPNRQQGRARQHRRPKDG
jgi:hypothetical protein